METFVEFCGMTEAVLALLIMFVIGITSVFVNKKDIEKLNREEADASR